MDKKADSAVSVVILFVMILAIFGLAIGTWALIGIPTQIEEAQFMHSLDLENSFGNMQSSLEALKDESREMYVLNSEAGTNVSNVSFYASPYGLRNLTYSMLLPVGMQYFTGTLELKKGVGTFYINATKEEIRVDRLSVTFGSDSEIGYEGGGVFRRDGKTARWVIKPHLKELIGPYGAPIYELRIPTFVEGEISSLTTNADVAIDLWYLGNLDAVELDPYLSNYDVKYVANEAWDARLWYEFLYEAHGSEKIKEDISYSPGSLTVSGAISPNSISNIINMKYGTKLKSQ